MLNAERDDTPETLVFVHVGKCAGKTLWFAINDSPKLKSRFSNFKWVHVKKPPIYQHANYLLVVRNPIQRVLSAFNWRYRLLVLENTVKRQNNPEEYSILKKYYSLNRLAESLYNGSNLDTTVASELLMIGHVKTGFQFHLIDLLDRITSEQVYAVVTVENLADDCKRYLGAVPLHAEHENRNNVDEEQRILSVTARKNLKRFFCAEYQTLENLFRKKSMTETSIESMLA